MKFIDNTEFDVQYYLDVLDIFDRNYLVSRKLRPRFILIGKEYPVIRGKEGRFLKRHCPLEKSSENFVTNISRDVFVFNIITNNYEDYKDLLYQYDNLLIIGPSSFIEVLNKKLRPFPGHRFVSRTSIPIENKLYTYKIDFFFLTKI